MYSIGEVEELLGVRAHVLRYWEREVPLLSPQKGASGRREYSESDIAMLHRLKHLLYVRRLSLDEASSLLETERLDDPAATAAFSEIRHELIRAWFGSRRLRGRLPGDGDPDAGT